MAIGPRTARRWRNHFHFAMAEKQYEKVAEAAMAEIEGGMCWPVEWFKEDLLEAQKFHTRFLQVFAFESDLL